MSPIARRWMFTVFGLKWWAAFLGVIVLLLVGGCVYEWMRGYFPALFHPGWELSL